MSRNTRTDSIGCSKSINLLRHWRRSKNIFVQGKILPACGGVTMFVSVEEGWRKNKWQVNEFICVTK